MTSSAGELKFIEIRDEGTFVVALALRLERGGWDETQDEWLLGRAGWGRGQALILLMPMHRLAFTHDPHKWADRTFQTAHSYLYMHWDDIRSGDVLDVSYVLGERPEPKISERAEREALAAEIEGRPGT